MVTGKKKPVLRAVEPHGNDLPREFEIAVAVFFDDKAASFDFQNRVTETYDDAAGRKLAHRLYALKITAATGQDGISRPRKQLPRLAAVDFLKFRYIIAYSARPSLKIDSFYCMPKRRKI